MSQRNAAPAAVAVGVHGEGPHIERGGPAARLREDSVRIGGAFGEQAALGQAHADEQQRHRKLIGDVLEVVTDFDRGCGPPPQEVQVIHFTDRFGLDLPSDLR
jgi:hypothetical protein